MSSEEIAATILPYSRIVGQEQLKLALELSYISPPIGGVLISGERGTGKSTIVRAFARMIYGKLPITLPINATEDRVVGDWDIDALMRDQEARFKPGLLEDADGTILYVDEINLLDDHIVNIILDTVAGGVLEVQRQGIDRAPIPTAFTLVGTMNPEEGVLRAQLLDRFGMVVLVETEAERRAEILRTMLEYEVARMNQKIGHGSEFFIKAWKEDARIKAKLDKARERAVIVPLDEDTRNGCVKLATVFEVVGHRCEYIMALAARALAALEDEREATLVHLRRIAPLALVHRRFNKPEWSETDDLLLAETLGTMM